MKFLNQALSGVAVPLLLLVAGAYFLVAIGWRIFLAPRRGLQALMGKDAKSAARALSVALGGTLGVGNIAGVATAIALGGAGAVFWMWVSALLAMLLKYAEIVLALRSRRYDEKGRAHGGAMYYIKEAFEGRVGKGLAGLFAVLCVVCSFLLGGVIQSNAAAGAMADAFGAPPLVTGVVIGALAALILACGARHVEDACTWIVPLVCVGFTVASVAVLILRREALPDAFGSIFAGALHQNRGTAGVLGFFTSRALRYGVARGLISNEAGCGTAPIAHAAADTKSHAAQGLWGILEVFVDTVLLCTLTALVILVSGVPLSGEGVALAISAYGAVLGRAAPPILALSILLFAFATVLSWSHYGAESLLYLTRRESSRKWMVPLVAAGAVLGSISAATPVWELTDLVIALMAVINIAALVAKRRDVIAETKLLYAREKRKEKKSDKCGGSCVGEEAL